MFLLFRHHVAVMDRKSFGRIGSEPFHFFRISIATGLDDLKEAVARLAEAGRDSAGFRSFIKDGTRLY